MPGFILNEYNDILCTYIHNVPHICLCILTPVYSALVRNYCSWHIYLFMVGGVGLDAAGHGGVWWGGSRVQ